MYAQGTTGHLIGITASKGLIIESQGAHGVEALLIQSLQQVEVELPLQVACRVLPVADLLLEGSFLLDESDGIDTFVHTDGVLPVV